MLSLQEILLVGLILTDLALLGAARMRHLIQLVAAQGALLAGLLYVLNGPGRLPGSLLLLCVAVLGIKAGLLPAMLARTRRKVGVKVMVEPHIGFNFSVALGVVGLLFSLWLEQRLAVPREAFRGLLLPAASTSILSGLLLIIGRRKALTQVVGYLVMENGIFLFGAPMAEAGAVWVELSVLLDVFVAVFVMGIAIHRISQTFDSIDVDRFCALRD